MKKKSILIVSCVFPPEPVVSARLSRDIALALASKYNVTVLRPQPTRPYGYRFIHDEIIPGVEVIQVKSYTNPKSSFLGRFKESFSFGRHVSRFISSNAHRIDLVYQNSWPMFSQYFAVRACQKAGIPVITHVQDVYPESISVKLPTILRPTTRLFKWVDCYTLQKSAKVIAISSNMHEYLRLSREIDSRNLETVYNWQEIGTRNGDVELDPQLRLDHSKRNFVFLGNIGPMAGLDVLIRSFHMSSADSRLVIAGTGSSKADLILLRDNIKASNVYFLEVPFEQTKSFLQQADVCVLTMLSGQGNFSVPSKLLAYFDASKAVLGFVDEDSDTSLMIKAAKAGWVASTIDELNVAVRRIETTPTQELRQNGLNGHQYASRVLSKEINLKKLKSIIERRLNV